MSETKNISTDERIERSDVVLIVSRSAYSGGNRLRVVPMELDEACAFVTQHHRHHKPPQGHRWSIGVECDGKIVGVAIVGRPVARMLQDGMTLEVTRLATDGTPNACSALYAAAWRAARELGYRRLITYILDTEPGTSLKAAGWQIVGQAGGGKWGRPSRPRVDKHPTQGKLLFERNNYVVADSYDISPVSEERRKIMDKDSAVGLV